MANSAQLNSPRRRSRRPQTREVKMGVLRWWAGATA